MLAALVPLLVGQPSPTAAFDRAIAAHRTLRSFDVRVELREVVGGTTVTRRFELGVRQPTDVRVRLVQPARGRVAAWDRTFWVNGNALTGYDAVANAVVRRRLASTRLDNRLAEAIGTLGPGLSIQVNGEAMNTFLRGFKVQGDWRSRNLPNGTEVFRAGAGGGARLTFDRASGRLLRAQFRSPQGALDWNYVYRTPASNLTPRIPARARPVSVFKDLLRPPTYRDAGARQAVARSIAAYDRLRHIVLDVNERGASTRIWISGGGYRERQAGLEWSYARRTVAVRAGTRFHRGPGNKNDVFLILANANRRMDPLLRALIDGENPMRELLDPGMTVRSVGTMQIGGKPVTIVAMDGPSLRVEAAIRADGLLASVATTNRDRSGRTIGSTERRYTIVSQGSPLPNLMLRPNAGERVFTLGPLKQVQPARPMRVRN